ncbi:MAG: transposase [Myxococcota bacterium]|jgi:transposase
MGTLIVDGYTAYNRVIGELGRARGGCWSYARRGLYEARAQDPKTAQRWLDAFGELFYIEHLAKDEGILASTAHCERRATQSAPILKTLFAELDAWSEAAVDHSNALYKAVQYVRNQREPLQLFVTEPAIPIHNNLSERALRSVALLRKNSLFAGHDEAADNYSMLLSLLATCRMHGVDPYAWLADVFIVVQEFRSKRTAEDLLLWNWKRDRGRIAKPLFDLAS